MLTQEIAYNEQVTYWPRTGPDGFGGDRCGAPQTIWVRWESDISEKIEGVKAAGETVIANAVVWSDMKLSQGDWLYRGVTAEAQPSAAGTRKGMDKAFIVRRVTDIPDVGGESSEYIAYL